MHTTGIPLGADGKPLAMPGVTEPIRPAGLLGKFSKRQRKLLTQGGRYRKDKRKPILQAQVFENGRIYDTWVHPTKGKRKVRHHG